MRRIIARYMRKGPRRPKTKRMPYGIPFCFGFGVFFDIIKYVFRIINLAKMRRYHSEELMEIEGGVGDHE